MIEGGAEMMAKAVEMAARAHAGQVDKSGLPVILHPLRVAMSFEGGPGEVPHYLAFVIAVLHDTVEDTDLTLEEIETTFGFGVSDAVDALTRREGESYWDFIERSKRNSLARGVKIADVNDNLRRCIDDARYRPEMRKWAVSMIEKYARALDVLLG